MIVRRFEVTSRRGAFTSGVDDPFAVDAANRKCPHSGCALEWLEQALIESVGSWRLVGDERKLRSALDIKALHFIAFNTEDMNDRLIE